MRRFSLCLFLFLFAGCSPVRYFYYPNRILYHDPDRLHLDYSLIEYPSTNGKTLYGYFFRTKEKPRGTIVHFHGNYGNMTNHFPLALFLLKEGFDVLSFDYQGYGGSEGTPTPKNTIEDGLATVRYAQEHLREKNTGVGVLGQSLGGAIAIVVAAQTPDVRGAVIEASFDSYRQISKVVLRRHWLTYPLSWIISPWIGRFYDPARYVAQISPRPLLFIHGETDRVVPVKMSRELYAEAKDPKRLWVVPGAGHLECRRKVPQEYDQAVAEFFRQAIPVSSGTVSYIDHNRESSTSL